MESGLKSLSSYSATNSASSLMARSPFPQPPLPANLQAPPAPARSPRMPAASPSKKRAARAGQEEAAGWTSMDYPMYSVSPPPSSVPMPTSLLLAAASGRKKAPTACAVEIATGAGGVDVGATDELRRLLRL